MIHLQDNRVKKLLFRNNVTIALIFGICLFALLFSPVRNFISRVVYSVAPPVWSIGDSALRTADSFVTIFRSKSALVMENRMLLSEIDRMQALVLDRNLLSEKVTKLEESLGRVILDDRVSAEVLVGAGRSPYDTLIINAGEEEGLSVNDVVVYAGRGAIGEIIEVSSKTSKVKLISSPGDEHNVLIGEKNIPAIALGRGMGNFESKVPENSTILVGDDVRLSGRDVIIGVVSVVEEKPSMPFKSIFFRLPFNISEIQSVEVIK